MPIINLKTGSPEWKAYHAERIGGHATVAILLGGNPDLANMGIKVRGTPLSVFLQLTGRLEDPKSVQELEEQKEVAAELQWGIDTEALHLKMLSRDTGMLVQHGLVHQHPEHDWLMASIDGYGYENGSERIIELKAPTWAKRDWREGAPWAAQVQCAFYAMVVGADRKSCGVQEPVGGIVSALLPPSVAWSKFERDPSVEQWIMEVLIDFREKHWMRDIPPEPVGAADYKVMSKMWPKDSGKTIFLPAECESDAILVANLSERIASEEKALEAAKARLMSKMGDATEAVVGGQTFTWKTEVATYKAQPERTITKRVFRRKKGKSDA